MQHRSVSKAVGGHSFTMEQIDFQNTVSRLSSEIELIKECAHALHASVNQTYDGTQPYGVHLDMVVDAVYKYGHSVCADQADVLPLFFGAYFHDSMEDARQSYNDVTKTAMRFMNDHQAYTAAEIVYALTNEKGRTREERAGEKYYQGIRETPYAPFVKLADRLANITYSFARGGQTNTRMQGVYMTELPHFLTSIDAHQEDQRFSLPEMMVEEVKSIVYKKDC